MSSSKRVISNLLWRFAERCGAQAVAFIVSVVLARILDPSAYGTVALITVFIAIVQVFVDSGLGNSLIQKKDADDTDFSTVFYTNVAFCVVLYLLIFAAAPLIAAFYARPEIVPYIRVLSLTVIVSGVKNVQQAYVSRHMMFKKFFFSTLGGTIAAGVIGVIMALNGAGIWALVAQQLINVTIDTCILWITVRWRPIRCFSWERLKKLYSFGWKLLASSLLDTVYREMSSLIIGKMYTSADLAYFNQGDKFPKLIITNINTSIDSVLLPTLSDVQDEKEKLKALTSKAIKLSCFILSPLMIGMAAVAEPMVHVVLTDKWLPCVNILRIFCFVYLLYPIHTANLNAIKAVGRSDIYLRLEIIKKLIGFVLLVASMWFGVEAMAWSFLIMGIVSQLINAWPNKELLDYGFAEQLRDVLPAMLPAAVMGILVYIIGAALGNSLPILILQITAGALIYLLEARIFMPEAWNLISMKVLKKIRH